MGAEGLPKISLSGLVPFPAIEGEGYNLTRRKPNHALIIGRS